ncbi:MAG: FAD-binding oxidoreductase [Microthrixaceae bacterium]|nr:FAD-binding oxidoreductase [Microthrixaceae bacterium]MCB9386250.1 FAD-binding oxidoreductase [Microthrixaceae bacterium]
MTEPEARPTDLVLHPELLSGWGRTAPSESEVVSPRTTGEHVAALGMATDRGLVPRGLGRGYGDCAQNAGGLVLSGPANTGITDIDLGGARVTARAGTSLHELMERLVPLGLFVPVTPGTRMVTVGGAIAADIHGKNHHQAGSWCDHVESFRMLDGNGDVREISADGNPEAFWATAGGMGLTGVVLDATIRMKPVTSSRLLVDTDRANDLDDVMSLMIEGDDRYDYSVAWIDLVSSGSSMGRSVLDRGRFATAEEVSAAGHSSPLEFRTTQLPSPPDLVPSGLLNRASIRAFNELWFRKAPARRRDAIMSIEAFFHPLDMIAEWNRIYGKRGFLQWQCVVPDSESETIRRAVSKLSGAGISSFLAVLKRMGPSNQGHLSFPLEGWTLALDMPVSSGLESMLDELDEMVVTAGGRIYLAKDSRVRPELIPVMYPRLAQWQEIREKLDPDRRFRSDMSRRLGLI